MNSISVLDWSESNVWFRHLSLARTAGSQCVANVRRLARLVSTTRRRRAKCAARVRWKNWRMPAICTSCWRKKSRRSLRSYTRSSENDDDIYWFEFRNLLIVCDSTVLYGKYLVLLIRWCNLWTRCQVRVIWRILLEPRLNLKYYSIKVLCFSLVASLAPYSFRLGFLNIAE